MIAPSGPGWLQRFLVGLARGEDANQLSATITDLHVRNNTFPGGVFMELAADALDLVVPHAPNEEPLFDHRRTTRLLPDPE